MEPKSILKQAWTLVLNQRRRLQRQRAVAAMACAVVFVTVYLLILPAITMEHSTFEITAASSEAALGETIHSEIYAEADNGREETFFVLNVDGDNAGLDESQLRFGSDGAADITDEDGRNVTIHREYTENGEARYWFVLPRDQSVRFSLLWTNGADRFRTEVTEEEVSVQPEEEPEKVTEEVTSEEETSEPEKEITAEESGTAPPAEKLPAEESVAPDADTDEGSLTETKSAGTEEVLSDETFSPDGNSDEKMTEENSEENPESPGEERKEEKRNSGKTESVKQIRTETILMQSGNPQQEGSMTISCGSGRSVEEAAERAQAESGNTQEFFWKQKPVYVCGTEEHTHDAAICYDGQGQLICEKKEHLHTEECLRAEEEENTGDESVTEEENPVYKYEDDFLSVTAVPEYPDAIPEDAEFRVTPVREDSKDYCYEAYMEALRSNTNVGGDSYDDRNILLYDIAFLVKQGGDTVEYQPEKGSVQIEFTFRQPQAMALSGGEDDTKIQVVHLPLVSEVREKVNTTAEAGKISVEDIQAETVEAEISGEPVGFSLDSFSLVAFVTQEDGNVIPITEVTPGLDYTYRDVLGNAINYGITANEVHKEAHMDTTFAASHVTSNGGNITTGAYTGSQGSPLLIGSITGSLRIDGRACTVYTTTEAAKSIELQDGSSFQYRTEQEITGQIESMLAHAQQVSQIMAAQRTYSVMKYGTYWDGQQNVEGWYIDQNDANLNISDLPAGTYYIDGDTYLNKNNVNIRKNSNQTIVFNLTGKTVDLRQFQITNVDTGSSMNSGNSNDAVYPFASTLIFNMPNADKVNVQSGIFGVLIAPQATVTIRSTSSGWIVADTVTNPGGEWHFVYQDLTEPLPVTVMAKKTLDGEAPDEQTKFSFEVERWDDTTKRWAEAQTVQNFKGDILFRETFSEVGTYYYRISEINGGGAYQYDTTQYIVKIDVTAIQENILQAKQTFYKTGEKDQLNNDTKAAEILFQNTTGQPGYVLPETGGSGIFLFTSGGMVLTAAAAVIYIILRRKEDAS